MPQNAPTPNNTYCCILSCGSKACRETHLSFHNFPKFGKYVVTVPGRNGKSETMDLRMAWLKATQNEGNTKPHMRVCSKHFYEHDFYSSALSPLAKRRKLRTNAVPSLHLNSEFADRWSKGQIIPKTGSRCAVKVCNNSHIKTREYKKLNISYHTFPKDDKTFEAWCKACDREDDWNPKTSLICSVHFLDEDFDTSCQSSVMGGKIKRRLNRNAIPKLLINASDMKSDVTRRIRKKRSLTDLKEPTVSKKYKKQKIIFDEPIKEERNESKYEVERIPHFTFVDINSEFPNEFIISDDDEEVDELEEKGDIQWEGPLTINKKGNQPPHNSAFNAKLEREPVDDQWEEPLTKTKKANQPSCNTDFTAKVKIEEPKKPEYIDFSVFSDLVVKIKKPQMNNTEDEFDIKGKDYAEKLRLMTPKQRSLVEKLVAEIMSQATMNRLKSHVLNLILGK